MNLDPILIRLGLTPKIIRKFVVSVEPPLPKNVNFYYVKRKLNRKLNENRIILSQAVDQASPQG